MRKALSVGFAFGGVALLAGCGGSHHAPSAAVGTITIPSGGETLVGPTQPSSSSTTRPPAPVGTQSPGPSTTTSGSSPPASVTPPTTVAGSTDVVTPEKNHYQVTLAPSAGSAPCALAGDAGRTFPFTVTIRNTATVTEPLARVGLHLTDNAPPANARQVAAISYQGVCLNFTEPGGTLAPGAATTYTGTVSGAGPSTTLVADVISTPLNTNLGSVSLAAGA